MALPAASLAQVSALTQAVQGRRRKEHLVSVLSFGLVYKAYRIRAIVGLEGATVAHATEKAKHHATKLGFKLKFGSRN